MLTFTMYFVVIADLHVTVNNRTFDVHRDIARRAFVHRKDIGNCRAKLDMHLTSNDLTSASQHLMRMSPKSVLYHKPHGSYDASNPFLPTDQLVFVVCTP
jgi:hypothetical protein